MDKRLSVLTNPKTIALIGATERPESVGAGLVENLWNGREKRKIFWVNPNLAKIKGEKTYNSILDLKEKIDLAIIAVPAKIVPDVVEDCCQKNVGSIIIISAGFAEAGEEGLLMQKKILETVRRHDIPLLGPNCLGLIRPQINLNASFAPFTPERGEIAFISQSGALMNSVIDRSGIENYGFSNLISYGNGADLSLVDFLWFAKEDQQTKIIAVYLEGLDRGREFMEVAQSVSEHKPIIVLKSGKTTLGQKATISHTASLAGSDKVYRAAFRQSGIIIAETLEELFDQAKALAWQPRIKKGAAVITNGGGMGVLATDAAVAENVFLPELNEKAISILSQENVMPEMLSFSNPLDIIGDADTERYRVAIKTLLKQDDINLIVVIQTKQTMTNIQANMETIVQASRSHPDKAIISVCLPGKSSQESINWLENNKIPNYSDPVRAMKAARALMTTC